MTTAHTARPIPGPAASAYLTGSQLDQPGGTAVITVDTDQRASVENQVHACRGPACPARPDVGTPASAANNRNSSSLNSPCSAWCHHPLAYPRSTDAQALRCGPDEQGDQDGGAVHQ